MNEKQAKALEAVLDNFPYFQSARALYLKGLYNQDSYKYNFALKHTAAHTSDRSVLFDFITSDEFTIIEKDIYERKLAELQDIIVNDSELLVASENSIQKEEVKKIIEVEIENVEISTEDTFSEDLAIIPEETEEFEAFEEKSISNEVELEIIEDRNTPAATHSEAIEIEDKLEIGKPIAFSQNEKHSFEEWLQITKIQPINRTESCALSIKPTTEATPEIKKESNSKKKKIELIDKFIESNPKITPAKDVVEKATIAVESSENTQLMTETLARVYLEQKKYQKAIQAYEILILKYPEKSIFFADRIKDIKILQQNNQ
uniref:tetratricopeptide repeat protein n=1 Tax=Flavobacterium orientale TaxID=1756020 RepID=UPI003570AB8F